MSWRERAACRDRVEMPWDRDLEPETAALCIVCPVRVECLTEALERETKCDVGVWGATGPKERHRIRSGQLTVDAAWRDAAALAAQPVLA